MELLLIFAFTLHCFTAFLLYYCCDTASLWGDCSYNERPKLHQPRLKDLNDEEFLIISEDDTTEEMLRKNRKNETLDYKREEQRLSYIEKIISPAYCYFKLKEEIENYQQSSSTDIGLSFFLQLSSLLLMANAMFKLEVSESFILCVIISVIPCVFASLIINLIYKRTPLKLTNYTHNSEKLKRYERLYENFAPEYKISKENYINNCIIKEHNEYLNSIKRSVVFRYAMRRIIVGLSAVIFFVFFFTIPEY